MTNEPRISVVMSVFNGERYLHDAMESVLNQTFKDFEFIIIDDASTDQSLSIIKSFGDPRVILINNENNLGLTKNLNKGLGAARGEFIARMDADDICHLDRFKTQVEFLENNTDIAMCGTWIAYFGRETHVAKYPTSHQEIKMMSLYHNPFAHPAVMWRKKEFERHNLRYDENFKTSQDYELWSRMIHILRTANIPETLLYYRLHDNQISTSKQFTQQNDARRIKLAMLKNLDVVPSAEEITAHYCMFDGAFVENSNAQAVRNADEWMYKLNIANKKKEKFSEKLFYEFWKSRFFGGSFYHYDMKIWSVLKSSWCVKLCRVSAIEKLKVFLKCSLRWKTHSSKSLQPKTLQPN